MRSWRSGVIAVDDERPEGSGAVKTRMTGAPRDPGAEVAVIVVNWNGAADTLAVVRELDRVQGPPLRTIVVDNGSTDDSVATLRDQRPELELVETGSNLGFAAGNLAGIRHAVEHHDFGWLLLLNNDVAVDPGFIPPLIEACLDETVAAAGPKIYYWKPPDLIWAAGGRLRVRETVTAELGRGRADAPRWDIPRDVSYLTTCCLLLPRDVLERIGPLDPVFFIGVEDADWCRRALNAGYRLRYVPASRIWHKVAVSTGGSYTPMKTYHTGRSNALFARRHFGALGLLVFVAANAVALAWALVRETARGNTGAVLAKARGLWRGLRDPLPEPPRLQAVTARRRPHEGPENSGAGA